MGDTFGSWDIHASGRMVYMPRRTNLLDWQVGSRFCIPHSGLHFHITIVCGRRQETREAKKLSEGERETMTGGD